MPVLLQLDLIVTTEHLFSVLIVSVFLTHKSVMAYWTAMQEMMRKIVYFLTPAKNGGTQDIHQADSLKSVRKHTTNANLLNI